MSNAINDPATDLDPLTSLGDFCTLHDVHPDLIPANRRQVEWDRLKQTKEALADLPDTSQTVRMSELIDSDQIGGDTQLVQTYLWLCGSFVTHKARRKTRWSNPEYLHGDAHITPADNRRVHVEKALELPTIPRNRIAERFNITPDTLSNWMHANGYRFRKRQTESKAQVGRSIKLSAAWSDVSVRECARIFPAPERTVRDWVYDFAGEFEPPEYPDTARW